MSFPAWVGLGANLGDARAALREAVRAIEALPGTRLREASSLYRSAPVDAGGPDYLNAAIAIETSLDPLALLEALLGIELAAGRERPYHHAPRTLDLDLLRYADVKIESERLTVPHPRSLQRAFVLQPLSELSGTNVTQEQLAGVADQRIERVASCREWLA